jgi:hypothetical protein
MSAAHPPSFAARCGVQDAAREAACLRAAASIEASKVDAVRLSWCDLHGQLRGKTLEAPAAIRALRDGVGMVGTLMLKDTGDKTAWKVFEASAARLRRRRQPHAAARSRKLHCSALGSGHGLAPLPTLVPGWNTCRI